MDKILELQKKILTDSEVRKALCDDPKGFLEREGIQLPEGVELPESFSLEDVENQVTEMEERLTKRGLSFRKIGKSFNPSLAVSPRLLQKIPTNIQQGIHLDPGTMNPGVGGNIGGIEDMVADFKDNVPVEQTAGVVVVVVAAYTAVGL